MSHVDDTMEKLNGKNSPRKYKGMKDGSLIERFCLIMESLAQRLKRDGLKLFLLVLANGFYLYLGGVIFYFLERQEFPLVDTKKQVLELYRLVNEENELGNTKNGSFYRNLTIYQIAKVELMLDKILKERLESSEPKWTMMNSVFFASTVVTTIGYGNLAPQTGFGRAFCVVYAVFGIPLTLILLAKVGKILAKYINELCGLVVQSLRRYFYPDYTYESTDGETDLNAPVWLAMLLITVFLTFDAVVFMFMEHWSFGNSLYFIFITLTTIGFGDIVPKNSEAVWFNVTFLYIGLAAVSITINLFIANISIQFRRHKDKFKIVKHIESELDSETDNETTPLTQGVSSQTCEASPATHDPDNLTEDETELHSTVSKPMYLDKGDNTAPSKTFVLKPKRKTSRVRFQTED